MTIGRAPWVVVTGLPVAVLASAMMIPAFDWRSMLMLGGIGALLVWYIRNVLPFVLILTVDPLGTEIRCRGLEDLAGAMRPRGDGSGAGDRAVRVRDMHIVGLPQAEADR